MCVRVGADASTGLASAGGEDAHAAVVNAGGHAGVADVGVHCVGEVDRGGPARQGHDATLGREDVDLVREQVNLHVLDELQAQLKTHDQSIRAS